MADAIAQYDAARRTITNIADSELSSLVSANIIADAIAAQTAAIQQNTQVLADFAQQVYEEGMYDDEEEEEEDWDIDDDRDARLRNLGDA